MAFKVPVYSQQQVSTTPLPSPSASAAPSGLAALGAGIEAAGADVAKVAFERKAQDDQTAVFNAVAEYRSGADSLTTEWDAMGGPSAIEAAPQVGTKLTSLESDIRARLSPDQQRGFDLRAPDIRNGVSSYVDKRSGKLRIEGATLALQNVVQTFTSGATDAAAAGKVFVKADDRYTFGLDETEVEARWKTIKEAIEAHGAAFAASLPTDQATWERLALEAARSDLTEGVVNGLLERGDDRAARLYYDKWKDALDDKARGQLAGKVQSAYHVGTVSRESYRIFREYADDEGTWSERVAKMAGDVKKLPEDESKEVQKDTLAAVESLADQAQRREAQAWRDTAAEYDKQLRGKAINPLDMQRQPAFLDLPPEHQRGLIAEANREARNDFAVTDPDLYDTLKTQIARAPLDYLGQDIDQYEREGRLNHSDADALRADQNAIFADYQKGEAARNDSTVSVEEAITIAAYDLFPGDSKSERKARGDYRKKVDAARRAMQQAPGGKLIGPAEINEFLEPFSAETAYDVGESFLGIDVLNPDDTATAIQRIPAESLAAIVEALVIEGGPSNVTAENIRDKWLGGPRGE